MNENDIQNTIREEVAKQIAPLREMLEKMLEQQGATGGESAASTATLNPLSQLQTQYLDQQTKAQDMLKEREALVLAKMEKLQNRIGKRLGQ